MKSFIRTILPKRCICSYKYWQLLKHAHKTYYQVEKELDKKFQKRFGQKINWGNPKTYNEKLNISKLYNPTPIKTQLTDKILVREWVKRQVSERDCKLIPLITTFNSIDEIDFSKLPEKYVIKMNNDSGSVFIHDKFHPLTKELLCNYRHYYQKRNFAYQHYEMHYKNIKPRVMIEQHMGDSIRDYKFQCFDGEVAHCQVDFDRFSRHTRNFYDKNWDLLPFNNGNYKNYPDKVEKPTNYEKMWHLAKKLSKGFDQVRVDFYDIAGQIYFGEMTFTNASGLKPFHPNSTDERLGRLWHLDMDAIRKRRQQLLSSNAKLGD